MTTENTAAAPRATALEKFVAKNQAAIDAAKASAVTDKETQTVTIAAETFYSNLPEGLTRESLDLAAGHVKNHVGVVLASGNDSALELIKKNKEINEVTVTGKLGEFGETSLVIKRAGPGFNEGDVVHGASTLKVSLDATRGDVGPVKAIREDIKSKAGALFGGK